MSFDLTHLTLLQLLGVLLVTAAIDTLSGIFGALDAKPSTFSWGVVANFLQTHVLARVFPILGLGFLAQTLGVDQSGAAIWGAALLGLAAYIAETVSSVSSNVGVPSVPVVAKPTTATTPPGA
jgi:hypothetical protein